MSQSNDQTNSNYVLIDKGTHEELRKNIEDYKHLIVLYEKTKFELDNAKSDAKIDNEKILGYQKMIVELQDKIIKLNARISSLEKDLEKANSDLAYKNKIYKQLETDYYKVKQENFTYRNHKIRDNTQVAVIIFLSVTVAVLIGQQ